MKSISILKSSLVELTLSINETTYDCVFSITSGNVTVSTPDSTAKEAIRAYQLEVARLHNRALKLLENRIPKPWQNVLSKFQDINKLKAKDFDPSGGTGKSGDHLIDIQRD